MTEFRAALRGVPIGLLVAFFAAMVVLGIGSLFSPAPVWAPAAYAVLMFVPGLAAGLAAGGGWKRGLLSGALVPAPVVVVVFAVLFGRGIGAFLGSILGTLLLAASSALGGAAGGALRARHGLPLARLGSAIGTVLGTDQPRPGVPRWLVVLQWSAALLFFLALGGVLPRILEWPVIVIFVSIAIVSRLVKGRTRKPSNVPFGPQPDDTKHRGMP